MTRSRIIKTTPVSDLSVGQKLIYVPSHVNRRTAPMIYEVEVEKIGIRWAYLKGGFSRIDRNDLYADGGQYSSPGQCYLSREAYETKLRIARLWETFREKTYRRPMGLDADAILRAAECLGIELADDESAA